MIGCASVYSSGGSSAGCIDGPSNFHALPFLVFWSDGIVFDGSGTWSNRISGARFDGTFGASRVASPRTIPNALRRGALVAPSATLASAPCHATSFTVLNASFRDHLVDPILDTCRRVVSAPSVDQSSGGPTSPQFISKGGQPE